MRRKSTDVIIVGKGIAGLTLSILLKRAGVEHVLLDRSNAQKKPALSETLPPSALMLLNNLDLLELFKQSSSKTFGYHSMWGNEQIVNNNFFFHNPYKHGLKLKKAKLLKELTKKVEESTLSFDAIKRIDTSGKGVEITVKNEGELIQLNGKFVVDATGRNRAIVKQLNVPIETRDHLVAFTAHVPRIKHEKLKHNVFVESFDNGWGIVSSLNKSTNVVTIFTEKGNEIQKSLKDFSNWKEILKNTKILKDLVNGEAKHKVTGGDANSSKPVKVTGQNWLAIGDAAMGFDPLSSHGVSNSIYCAQQAAKTLSNVLESADQSQLLAYDQSLTLIFDAYWEHKTKLYASEKRWKSNSFWEAMQPKLQTA